MPGITPCSKKIPLGSLGSASCGTTTTRQATTMSQHSCTLGLAVTKKFGPLTDHKRSFVQDLLLQSGADGSHVFVRIRNEWSSESKQLRRAITITWCILLPCLLSCLISQLGAFPGKAHVEVLTCQGGFSPISSAAATPHLSPCLPHPSAATLEPQHKMIYHTEKKRSF